MFKKGMYLILSLAILMSSVGSVYAETTSSIDWHASEKQFEFTTSSKGQKIFSASLDDHEALNQTWNDFTQSFLSIEYLNRQGKVKRSSSKHAKIKAKEIEHGYELDVSFKATQIQVKFQVIMQDDMIEFILKDQDLIDPQNQLVALYPFPFLFASEQDNPKQYYLVPEGSGALYRHQSQNKNLKNPYRARYYGPDYGSQGTGESMFEKKSLPKLSLPVYGAHLEEISSLAFIEKGAEYAELWLYPKGLITPYHWMSSKFIYRDQYFKMTNQKGDGYFTTQKERNHFDIHLKIKLFEGENVSYSEMAQWFKTVLFKDQQPLEHAAYMNIDLLMNEKKKTFLWDTTIPMTSFQEAEKIISDLQSFYTDQIHLNLKGLSKQGDAFASIQHAFPFLSKTGQRQSKQFLNKIASDKISTSIELNYMEMYPEAYRIKKTDYAQALSERNLYFEKENTYLMHPRQMQKYVEKEMERWKHLGVDQIYLKHFGQHLYASFDRSKAVSRSDALSIQQDIIQTSMLPVRLDGAYDFLMNDQASAISHLEMGSSGHILLDEDIPFTSLVLRSYIPYYSRNINLEGHRPSYLLRLLEYGAFPSYVVSEKDESYLIDSFQQELYGIAYDHIRDQIEKDWAFLEPAYQSIESKAMTSHEVIEEGVVKVDYGPISLVINYQKKPFIYQKHTVSPQSYLILGGEQS